MSPSLALPGSYHSKHIFFFFIKLHIGLTPVLVLIEIQLLYNAWAVLFYPWIPKNFLACNWALILKEEIKTKITKLPWGWVGLKYKALDSCLPIISWKILNKSLNLSGLPVLSKVRVCSRLNDLHGPPLPAIFNLLSSDSPLPPPHPHCHAKGWEKFRWCR